ncbi:hypothetical protein EMIHUDRAFT_101455 [Emiliania huxleyi CCMP1516]|uniref:Beta-lactamase-related domain-containing protein n=2 Tax=Emiliania huxleyi TaxID=2903 RepID=A0A0D3JFP9_EMIH1|nr:hypothetical protein EMIHUDRAFT_101455 [Emiliania huxleyi CCMP1516]EOD22334.1 hypothetical protein EMIHUDRAFT_101455 [Emiliania huxleyi CCMP1516]|eukprot:XP_005774763.1 hypothetical protein EMIHUDRAFT_101455 [Emiliania huxleyi CCMP1516]
MAGPRGGHVLAAATAVAAAVALLALIRRRRHLQGPLIDADLDGTWPLPLAQPEAVGLSTQRLSEISRWSDGWVGSGKLPGLFTAIARRGKLVYAHSSGSADVASGSPLTQHTLVRLYSLTKPLVSVCAMVLYEKGLFQLDEPVSHHLPSFANARVLLASGEIVPAEREVTVHHLLTHTAGLTYGDSDTAVDEAYKAAGCGWDAPYHLSLSDFVDRIGRLPLAFHPGESWRYSYATDVLGRLLEVISGLPLDRLMDETLFSPLGMADSGFVVPPEKLPRFAAIYEASEAPGRVGAVARQRRRFERGGSFATLLWSLRRSADAGSQPVLAHVLRQLHDGGVNKMGLSPQLEIRFVDLGATFANGFAASLLAARSEVGEADFLICTPDHLFDCSLVPRMRRALIDAAGGDGRPSVFDAVALVEEEPVDRHRRGLPDSMVRVAMQSEEHGGVAAVLHLGEGTMPEAGPAVRHGVEAGIYACTPAVFARLEELSLHLDHFALSEAMARLVEHGRLGGTSTRGRPWFAFERAPAAEQERFHVIDRRLNEAALTPPSSPLSMTRRLAQRLNGSPRPSSPSPPSPPSRPTSSASPPPIQAASPWRREPSSADPPPRPRRFHAGGGVVSTAHDYLRFAAMLLNRGELDGVRILSCKTGSPADSGFAETGFDGIGFGLGWSVIVDPIKARLLASKGEFGWGGWASTFFAVVPREQMIVLSLAQIAPSDRYPIRRQLRTMAMSTIVD